MNLIRKIKRATKSDGVKYNWIFALCPTGWKARPSKTVYLVMLAITALIFPLYEVDHGKYKVNQKPKNRKPVMDYLSKQGSHMPVFSFSSLLFDVYYTWNLFYLFVFL